MGRHYTCIVNEMSYICMLLFCTFAYRNNVQHSRLMKKIINPYLGKKGYKCICCSPDNPIGLHLQFWEEGDEVLTKWSPSENYQGWVDTLHGGVIAMLMDEVAGWVVNRKLQTAGMTTRLDVKYRQPVMTTEPLITIKGTSAHNAATLSPYILLLKMPRAKFVTRLMPLTSLSDRNGPRKWASMVAQWKERSKTRTGSSAKR